MVKIRQHENKSPPKAWIGVAALGFAALFSTSSSDSAPRSVVQISTTAADLDYDGSTLDMSNMAYFDLEADSSPIGTRGSVDAMLRELGSAVDSNPEVREAHGINFVHEHEFPSEEHEVSFYQAIDELVAEINPELFSYLDIGEIVITDDMPGGAIGVYVTSIDGLDVVKFNVAAINEYSSQARFKTKVEGWFGHEVIGHGAERVLMQNDPDFLKTFASFSEGLYTGSVSYLITDGASPAEIHSAYRSTVDYSGVDESLYFGPGQVFFGAYAATTPGEDLGNTAKSFMSRNVEELGADSSVFDRKQIFLLDAINGVIPGLKAFAMGPENVTLSPGDIAAALRSPSNPSIPGND